MTVAPEAGTQDGRALLEKCSLFSGLEAETRRQLSGLAHRRAYAARDVIFHLGSPGQSMMAVIKGTVRITVPSPQGKEIVLADLPTGAVFGEIALLDGRERTADAVALTNCELMVLERRDVLPLLERHSTICLRLLEVLCDRLRGADERITDIAFFELPVRLAKVLLRTAVKSTKRGPGDPAAKVSLSQRELGSMIGATREAVNRCLQQWQRREIVRLKEGWIMILAPEALEEIAGLA
jgi:CRP-like cAMP-binding protein